MITFRFLFKIREMRSGCMRGSRKCVQRMRFRGIFKFARRVRGIFSINLHYNLRNFNFQEVGGSDPPHRSAHGLYVLLPIIDIGANWIWSMGFFVNKNFFYYVCFTEYWIWFGFFLYFIFFVWFFYLCIFYILKKVKSSKEVPWVYHTFRCTYCTTCTLKRSNKFSCDLGINWTKDNLGLL